MTVPVCAAFGWIKTDLSDAAMLLGWSVVGYTGLGDPHGIIFP